MLRPSDTEVVTLVGRSSSHFTRVARMFAAELAVPYDFQIATELLATAPDRFGGNPALRLPVLRTQAGEWFGTLGICRELARRARREVHLVWPEQLATPLLSNAQELVLQAMATEVELIMSRGAERTPHLAKRQASLEASVSWLNEHVDVIVAGLPARDLSFLETTLFCLGEHLEFREVLSISPYRELSAFCDELGQRDSARSTPFAFDVAS